GKSSLELSLSLNKGLYLFCSIKFAPRETS
ncbi:MAG: hypothetical protein ACI8QW_001559, partial [Saprospiraceae bacterium]